jgi:hypothetical protein
MKLITPHKNLGLIMLAGLLASPPLHAIDKDPQLDSQIQHYWTAQAKSDWGAVYDLLPSQDKAASTRAKYIEFRKKTGVFNFTNAKTSYVEIVDDLAWVATDFDAKVLRFPTAPARHNQMWQLWQKTDNWHPVSEAVRLQHPPLPPKLRFPADETALTARAQAAWQAKSTQDWKGFYSFLPPDYRASVSLDEFLKKKSQYLYSAPHIDWVQVPQMQKDLGTVKITFAIKPNDAIAAKLDAQERTLTENWLKQNGDWYFDIPLPAAEKTAQVAAKPAGAKK